MNDHKAERVTDIQIRCLNNSCKTWFKSPISFATFTTFETCMLIGNRVQCPNCGQMTPCNKENVKILFEGGGFVGGQTS